LKIIILAVLLLYFYQRIRPVKELKVLDINSLCSYRSREMKQFQILDIRDQVDYYASHINGSINVSLGRLPYVKKDALHKDNIIVLISNSTYQSKRAARILIKCGYKHLIHLKDGIQAQERCNKKQQEPSLCA